MVLSILRSWAFFFPALDFAFFPMVKSSSELSYYWAYYFRMVYACSLSFRLATCGEPMMMARGLFSRVILFSLCKKN